MSTQLTPASSGCDISAGVAKRYEEIIQSPEDKRAYRGFLLKNRLKVLLISDPSTDIAAAALDVNIGCLSDAEDLDGLGHFGTYMLFSETKKHTHTVKNEYGRYISEHVASSNSFISYDYTVYHFDVVPSKLKNALNVFSQFFILPPWYTRHPVNSGRGKTKSDNKRQDISGRSAANFNNTFNRLGTGTTATLETYSKSKNIDVRKEVLFHYKWYSSNIMTLVVLGKESLDELEAMVVPLFSAIEDKSVIPPSFINHPYPYELRGRRIYRQTIKEMDFLDIEFPIILSRKYYKSKPAGYIAHLIRHQGPGGLLSAFKKRGWCTSLISGHQIRGRGFELYWIRVQLTAEGIIHLDDIINFVFQYIAMLKKKGPQYWIWEEMKNLLELDFKYKDVQEPIPSVVSHARRIQEFPIEDGLRADNLLTEWKPELITEYLAMLTPENVRLNAVGEAFRDKCTMLKRWYGTKHLEEAIPESEMKRWKEAQVIEDLHLPLPNQFVPSRLTLEDGKDPTSDAIAPEIVKDTTLIRLWYKKDNEFLQPKAVIILNLVSPLAYADALSSNLTSMWVLLLKDSLQEYAYAAGLAGLSWNVEPIEKYGIRVTIEGFDDKQHLLLEKIVDGMVNFRADPQRFLIMKMKYLRDVMNFEGAELYDHAIHQQALCLSDRIWPKNQLLEAAKDMTPEQLDQFVFKMIRNVHIEGLMYGNLSRERAIKMADSVELKWPKDGTPLLLQELFKEIELESGTWYVRETYNSVHHSSCALLYYACGVSGTRQNATLELLSQVLSGPCFSALGTVEQLECEVNNQVYRSNAAQGLRISVETYIHPAFLEEKIEEFMQGFLEHLKNISEEDLHKNKLVLAAQKLKKPKRMIDKALQLWAEIIGQEYNFDRARVEVEQLNTITKEELIQFYMKYISMESSERQKLSIYVISTAEVAADDEYDTEDEAEDNCTQKIEIEPSQRSRYLGISASLRFEFQWILDDHRLKNKKLSSASSSVSYSSSAATSAVDITYIDNF